ncbi:MAG: MFS transporter [Alphaproteobacteria bacterium]|nr:MFS transporter [Alphaproteobacteria bacterium]
MTTSETTAPPGAPSKDHAEFLGNAKWVALGILFVVYVFNFIDRQIFAILQESIKRDLGLSDTELGLLGGFTFALFYTTFGVPIARLADRSNRSLIIAVCLAVWSFMTILCGRAVNFWTLALARIGVGIGEAGCSPSAHSIISDYFPPKERAGALAIYSVGINVGVMFGFFAGGFIDQYFGWRHAFLAVGLPGLLFALVVKFFLKEPPRGLAEGRVDEIKASAPPKMVEAFKTLWKRRSFRHISVASGLHAFVAYGNQFLPPFFQRVHGFETGELSLWLGLMSGIVGGLGVLAGGWLSDRYGAKDRRWLTWIPAVAILAALPFAMAGLLVPSGYMALALLTIPAFLNPIYTGPTWAMTQGLVGPRMRAVAVAVLFFILNMVGLGFGPVAVGMLSDAFAAHGFGTSSIRWALLATGLINIWAAVHYILAARTLREEMAAAERGE